MLAAGLTALKLSLKIGHVEAGLRSFNWKMPEEHNRRMIDRAPHYLFARREIARRNLLEEHVWGEVFVTGKHCCRRRGHVLRQGERSRR